MTSTKSDGYIARTYGLADIRATKEGGLGLDKKNDAGFDSGGNLIGDFIKELKDKRELYGREYFDELELKDYEKAERLERILDKYDQTLRDLNRFYRVYDDALRKHDTMKTEFYQQQATILYDSCREEVKKLQERDLPRLKNKRKDEDNSDSDGETSDTKGNEKKNKNSNNQPVNVTVNLAGLPPWLNPNASGPQPQQQQGPVQFMGALPQAQPQQMPGYGPVVQIPYYQ